MHVWRKRSYNRDADPRFTTHGWSPACQRLNSFSHNLLQGNILLVPLGIQKSFVGCSTASIYAFLFRWRFTQLMPSPLELRLRANNNTQQSMDGQRHLVLRLRD
jgi:hypothetical protein